MTTSVNLRQTLLCIGIVVQALAARQNEVVNFVTQLALDLQKQQFVGVFNCWILHFADDSTYSTIQSELAYRLSANYISLMQVKHRGEYKTAIQDPSLAVIILGNNTIDNNDSNFLYWLARTPFESTTIVLYEHDATKMQLLRIGNYLAMMKLWNVILIPINIDAVYTFHYGPLRVLSHTGYPESKELFYDRLATLQTRYVRTALTQKIYTRTLCNTIPGEDLALFKLFADTINMQLIVEEFNCGRNETLLKCCSRYPNVDFLINRFFYEEYNKYSVSCMMMEQIAIATPKGRFLTIWEILVQPFQQSVWWIMLAICLGFEVLEIVIPTMFSNSLVSLALFGFEKFQLRFTKPTEKVTASALIMLFFLMTCAYEAKLISYITETPREPGASSIRELHDRNITVHHKNFNITHLKKLEGLLANSEKNFVVFDGLTIVDNRITLSIEMIHNEIDGVNNIPYKILDETVFEIMAFFTFQPKSPAQKPFVKYQQRVFEVGLPLHWRKEMLRCYRHHATLIRLKAHRKLTEHLIQIDKLKPLLTFFGIQWAIEVGFFIVEVIVGRYFTINRKQTLCQ
ncbi:uncharacterized protein LOC126565267 [Anopheles maculipalpis]|uniref:uncharacterized protein LOC126565267 n=1 Tax=Anopheles maculipalpis TaxID=1496333 RepID=UPI00215979B4|nr:uncharacterized protein LOC126565267 [Anopheles maculipalpis]